MATTCASFAVALNRDAGSAIAIPELKAGTYARHPLHSSERHWPEKNCYVDLWIEILHAKGFAPEAMLPFVVTADFEQDQWTFFKPAHDELRSLYGIKVHELTTWRPLLAHAIDHLSAGRLICTEVDAFWLPDTHGTDYQTHHSKTTIAINHVDVSAEVIGYFHNAGYYTAQGEDFRQLLRTDTRASLAECGLELPLYAELASFYPAPLQTPAQLREASLALMQKQLQWVPVANPVSAFAEQFARDLPALQAHGLDRLDRLEHYHAWAFAGIRQWGAACELAAAWIDWMGQDLPAQAQAAAPHFLALSQTAKSLILKGARAVATQKTFDPVAHLQGACEAWGLAVAGLKSIDA